MPHNVEVETMVLSSPGSKIHFIYGKIDVKMDQTALALLHIKKTVLSHPIMEYVNTGAGLKSLWCGYCVVNIVFFVRIAATAR